jgi:hypothetical protein
MKQRTKAGTLFSTLLGTQTLIRLPRRLRRGYRFITAFEGQDNPKDDRHSAAQTKRLPLR